MSAPTPEEFEYSVNEICAIAERHLAEGNVNQAEQIARTVLSEVLPAFALLAKVKRGHGDLVGGVEFLAVAVAFDPASKVLWLQYGQALFDARRTREAMRAAQEVLKLDPESADGDCLIGVCKLAMSEAEEAITYLERATTKEPANGLAWQSLGFARKDLGRLVEAEAALTRAAPLLPSPIGALSALATVLTDLGRANEGALAAERARQLDPNSPEAHAAHLFALNAVSLPPDEVFERHRDWGQLVSTRAAPRRLQPERRWDPERRLRVGYVSPDFRAHSVAFFIAPIIAAHERRSVEVICYHCAAAVDDVTTLIRKQADGFRSVAELSDAQLAERIDADAIDILVDLAGHTRSTRVSAFSLRPAPVQVSYLGYPNTTGLPEIDARITDAFADPPGMTEHLHTEELVRPNPSFICYLAPANAPQVVPPPCTQSGHVTFGSFNARAKINDEVISLWSRVLAAVPGSHLLLKSSALRDESTKAQLKEAFEAAGIERGRLELYGWDPFVASHLARYSQVDIALDTFPYHGTTTTCEALWMGVPVVTLAGQVHASRVGVSILSNIGLPDLVAADPDAYVALAANLAGDPGRLVELRQGLRGRMRGSPLLDALRLAGNLETAYRTLWRKACARELASRDASSAPQGGLVVARDTADAPA